MTDPVKEMYQALKDFEALKGSLASALKELEDFYHPIAGVENRTDLFYKMASLTLDLRKAVRDFFSAFWVYLTEIDIRTFPAGKDSYVKMYEGLLQELVNIFVDMQILVHNNHEKLQKAAKITFSDKCCYSKSLVIRASKDLLDRLIRQFFMVSRCKMKYLYAIDDEIHTILNDYHRNLITQIVDHFNRFIIGLPSQHITHGAISEVHMHAFLELSFGIDLDSVRRMKSLEA